MKRLSIALLLLCGSAFADVDVTQCSLPDTGSQKERMAAFMGWYKQELGHEKLPKEKFNGFIKAYYGWERWLVKKKQAALTEKIIAGAKEEANMQ